MSGASDRAGHGTPGLRHLGFLRTVRISARVRALLTGGAHDRLEIETVARRRRSGGIELGCLWRSRRRRKRRWRARREGGEASTGGESGESGEAGEAGEGWRSKRAATAGGEIRRSRRGERVRGPLWRSAHGAASAAPQGLRHDRQRAWLDGNQCRRKLAYSCSRVCSRFTILAAPDQFGSLNAPTSFGRASEGELGESRPVAAAPARARSRDRSRQLGALSDVDYAVACGAHDRYRDGLSTRTWCRPISSIRSSISTAWARLSPARDALTKGRKHVLRQSDATAYARGVSLNVGVCGALA